jgi:hypothetical protein
MKDGRRDKLLSMSWDVYLAYASKDAEIARSVRAELEKVGLKVWMDHTELKPGGGLVAKMDEGLRDSRAGVIILSPRVNMKRGWVRMEIDALMDRAGSAHTRIFPILHHMTLARLRKQSPLLAGLVAGNTRDLPGFAAYVRDTLAVSIPQPPGQPERHPLAALLFVAGILLSAGIGWLMIATRSPGHPEIDPGPTQQRIRFSVELWKNGQKVDGAVRAPDNPDCSIEGLVVECNGQVHDRFHLIATGPHREQVDRHFEIGTSKIVKIEFP